jgi:thiamine transport system permease protein
MAERGEMTGRLAALPAAALVLAAAGLGLIPLLALAASSHGLALDGAVMQVAGFTLLQAGLSTVLSVVPAIGVARALARRAFPGRQMMLALFAVPLSLPAIVAVLALVALYGSNGLFGGFFTLYGLAGILIAHVFFNLPLATRLLLESLAAVPPENFRLAEELGLSDGQLFRHVEWPALRQRLPGVASFVFLLCAASFVVVLTLGGGPSATTLEVAIYQSLRMDFDVARAASLSLIQIILCLVLVLAAGSLTLHHVAQGSLRLALPRRDGASLAARLQDGAFIVIGILVTMPPVIMLVADGLGNLSVSASLMRALGWSTLIGACGGGLAVGLALAIGQRAARRPGGLWQVLMLAAVIIPPAVMSTGWFLVFGRNGTSNAEALLLVILLNGLMALPFAAGLLLPRLSKLATDHDRLCLALGITGFTRFRTIDFPALRPVIVQAVLLATAIAMGDLTAITLLGNPDITTLASLIHQQMGNYRSDDAAGTSLVLAALCLALGALAARRERTA